MLIMGLDTSLQRCSVAILCDAEVVGEESADMERGHAERLAPMAAAALRQAGIKIADLDRVGVVVGPGGFTGVRVGLSFARGLAIGGALPVIGVTSLAALAGNVTDVPAGALIASIVDARRGQVYAAAYENNGAVRVDPFVADPKRTLNLLAENSAGDRVVTVGSGADLLPPPRSWSPSGAANAIDAKIVAHLAASARAPSAAPSPLYLRPPDAKRPAPGRFERRP